jgi:multicomponent Na+:H+ antiporter subunit D
MAVALRPNLLTLGASSVLVLAVVLGGLWPEPLLQAARLGAADMINPQRYIAAIGLAGEVP